MIVYAKRETVVLIVQHSPTRIHVIPVAKIRLKADATQNFVLTDVPNVYDANIVLSHLTCVRLTVNVGPNTTLIGVADSMRRPEGIYAQKIVV